MILKKRPTVDFVFMIPVALKASKRKHNTISLAFIEKAYDKVCRELTPNYEILDLELKWNH